MYYFHTCDTAHGRVFVEKNAPFISRKNGPKKWQWLSQGYYFWTDEDYFAHMWGRDAYNNNYAILKCQINISPDLVLDLASNLTHSLYFQKLMELYKERLRKINSKDSPTVSTVIEHFRKKAKDDIKLFPFEAIKAVDFSQKAKKLKFSPDSFACMTMLPRLQFCLFESSYTHISSKEIHHFS